MQHPAMHCKTLLHRSVAVFFLSASSVWSAGSGGTTTALNTPGTTTDAPQLVRVAIETSRTEVTSEGGYGIFADLQNIDSQPLILHAADTRLVIQPEIAGDHTCIFAVDGFYPTEQ